MQRCVFPALPLQQGQSDTRTFKAGETVCLRNDVPPTRVRGRYTRAHPQPGTGLVFTQIVDNRWHRWENVGKLEPVPVSPTAVAVVARKRNLPEDLEREIKRYGGKTRRRKPQRGRGVAMSRPAALPRVLIACHVPSDHGIVTWDGHEIVGYVDVQPGESGEDGLPYYQGWSAIPASLKGTLDMVVSMGCPVVPVLREGRITSFTEPPVESRVYEQDTYDIVNASLDLLRPGGILLFPRLDIVAPSIVTALKAKGATAELLSIPKPRWFKHGTTVLNDAFSKETLPGLQITKSTTGGRRYPLRSRRRSIRS